MRSVSLIFLYILLRTISIQDVSSQNIKNNIGIESIDSLIQNLPLNAHEGTRELEIIKEKIDLLDQDTKIKSLIAIGDYYSNSEMNDSAKAYFSIVLELAKKEDNLYYKALSYNSIAHTHRIFSEYDEAIETIRLSLKFALQTDSLELISNIYRTYGNIFWGLEIYDYALEYYFKSLEIAEKNGFIKNTAAAYNNIGNIYLNIKDYENARKYFTMSLKIAEELNSKWVIAISSNNLGNVMIITEKYDSALQYFKISQLQSQELGGKLHEGVTLFNMGEVYLKLDSLEIAKRYLKEAHNLAKQSNDKIGISNSLIRLGEAELRLGNLAQARTYIESGLRSSKKLGSYSLEEEALELKIEYFKTTGQLDSTVSCLTELLIIKDTLYSIENSEKITRLEYKYKEDQAALEIETLKKEKYITKILIWSISLGGSAFLIVLIIFLTISRKRNRELGKKNDLIEKHQKLLKNKNEQLIISQTDLEKMIYGKDKFITIMSHDLRNPVSAIRGFVELIITEFDNIDDDKKILFLKEIFKSIEKISLLINNILYWVNSQNTGIINKPENFSIQKRISDNISLYKLIAAGKNISISNKTNKEDYIFSDINIFDTIIRNLLSNSLKFTNIGGKITFKSTRKEDFVYLEIEDTGKGMSKEKLSKILNTDESHGTIGTLNEQGTGLGINLVKEFSKILDIGFDIISEEGKGTRFILKFHLSKK